MNETLEITGLAYGGSGVGRTPGGKVVFVPFTAPGDVVEVEITAEKKNFSEGSVSKLLTPSPVRTTPGCPYYGDCGGCALQHISYETQVELKAEVLVETLKRIGKTAPGRVEAPWPCPEPYGYRSRARFHHVSGACGFFRVGSNEIVDVESCPVATSMVNSVYAGIREAITVASAGTRKRLAALYEFEVVEDRLRGVAAATFHVTADTEVPWDAVFGDLEALNGFEVWMNPQKRRGGRVIHSSGETTIGYRLGDLTFEADASVFTQVNHSGNAALAARVVEYSGGGTDGRGLALLDLFAGVGNFTLPVARALGPGGVATGVEWDARAVGTARRNAAANGLGGVDFIEAGALGWLRDNLKTLEAERPGVVILDPPRGGDLAVARVLAGLLPEKLVYVSCSPPTLARDLALLAAKGYRPGRMVMVDMFPQTYHIESLVELTA